MTTGISQRSVLVIGASQRVLDDCVAALRDLGYTAQGTNEFFSDITGRFDVAHIDLVSLGGLVQACCGDPVALPDWTRGYAQ